MRFGYSVRVASPNDSSAAPAYPARDELRHSDAKRAIAARTAMGALVGSRVASTDFANDMPMPACSIVKLHGGSDAVAASVSSADGSIPPLRSSARSP